MLSYGDVRRWWPEPLADVEQQVKARSETLLGLADELGGAAKPAAWHGSAADAASLAWDRIADRLEHVIAGVEATRAALMDAATGVAELTGMVSAADRLAHADGFVIYDSGGVVEGGASSGWPVGLFRAVAVAASPVAALGVAVERERVRLGLVARVARVLARAEEIDDALARMLGKVARGEITDGGATTLAAAARAGAAQGRPTPSIPGPLPYPRTDSGAGEHGSDHWYTRADEHILELVLRGLTTVADLKDRAHAAALLRHYLGNSGTDFEISPDEMMRDAPQFRSVVERVAATEARKLAENAARNGTYGKPVPFRSQWDEGYIDDDKRDWYYAMRGFHYSVGGVATVQPPDQPGSAPFVVMDYQAHVYDRYNWDSGDKARLGSVDVPIGWIPALHRAGVAREFNTVGSSEVKHYEGPVPGR